MSTLKSKVRDQHPSCLHDSGNFAHSSNSPFGHHSSSNSAYSGWLRTTVGGNPATNAGHHPLLWESILQQDQPCAIEQGAFAFPAAGSHFAFVEGCFEYQIDLPLCGAALCEVHSSHLATLRIWRDCWLGEYPGFPGDPQDPDLHQGPSRHHHGNSSGLACCPMARQPCQGGPSTQLLVYERN